jgi:hypothetical protein
VSFLAVNAGSLVHELVILPVLSDGPGKGPTGTDGKIDESQSIGEAWTMPRITVAAGPRQEPGISLANPETRDRALAESGEAFDKQRVGNRNAEGADS